jgi:hypothetical protein
LENDAPEAHGAEVPDEVDVRPQHQAAAGPARRRRHQPAARSTPDLDGRPGRSAPAANATIAAEAEESRRGHR